MAHQLRCDARRRRAPGMNGRLAAACWLAALALVVALGPRVELFGGSSAGAPGATAMLQGTARWSVGANHHASPHVVVPDVRSATEQLARPLSHPGPLLLAATFEVLSVALAWTLLSRPRRSLRRRAAAAAFLRRGPPIGRAAQSSLLRRA